MDPVDWRAREFNTAADHVCNCILAGDEVVDTLGKNIAQLDDIIRLQIYPDGGFAKQQGAAGFVAVGITMGTSGFLHTMLGARGCCVHQVRSSFHAEVAALDMAVKWLHEVFFSCGRLCFSRLSMFSGRPLA